MVPKQGKEHLPYISQRQLRFCQWKIGNSLNKALNFDSTDSETGSNVSCLCVVWSFFIFIINNFFFVGNKITDS